MTERIMVPTGDGSRLAVWLDGPTDAPVITFGHSLAASSTMWAPQVQALASAFRLVRIDCRGHGGSSIHPHPSSFSRLAQDVVEVWDHLGIERSHYVGLSLGGIMGAALGIEHESRIDRLVLADCRFDANEAYLANWARRRQLLREGGMEAVATDTLRTWLTPEHAASDPNLVAQLKAGMLATSPEAWTMIVDLLATLDLKKSLHRIGVPTFVLCGTSDPVRQEMADCAKLIRQGSFLPIEAAAHLANLDQPETFTGAVSRFLSATGYKT